MTSAIVTTGIDATKPGSGNALTADVRSNFSAIKTQLDTAATEISALQAGGGSKALTQTVLTSGTSWTVPAGVTKVKYRMVGGGAGGSWTNSTSHATGGGAGGYCEGVLSVTPGGSLSYTIGAAGAAATATNTVGAAGGNTTLNGTITAGGAPAAAVSTATASFGGTATGADINVGGAAGTSLTSASVGGSGPLGGGAAATSASSNAPQGYGAGGVGARSTASPSAGTQGAIILEYLA